jgi:SAM-dependent methyltransferase
MTDVKEPVLRLHVDLSRRSDEAEWLDGPNLSPEELEAALRDLARFNGVMLGHRPILSWLRGAIRSAPAGQSLTLIDVGCGYGDLLRVIRRWSRRRGLSINLLGLDLNPETVRIARKATNERDQIDYEVADIFKFRSATPVDLIVSSLVAHHLSDGIIVDFLRWMEATARRGWLICDLQRHLVPYYFIGLAGKLARLHPMVIHDGRISVARSLTRSEWIERLEAAGIPRRSVTIGWFLFRHVIGRL